MEKITGKNNDLIKNVKKLLSSSKQRKEQGLFVLEGARLVFDVLNSFYNLGKMSPATKAAGSIFGISGGYNAPIDSSARLTPHLATLNDGASPLFKVKCFLITDNAYEKFRLKADEMINVSESSYIISDELSQKLSDTKASQGVFAVCYMKANDDFILNRSGRLIALDNLQDPGNLGTIVRTAEALGIDGIIVGKGCDIYNPKVLRGSMGSMLRMNVTATDDLVTELSDLKLKGYTVYGTSPDSGAFPINKTEFSSASVCVIGNEANGMNDEVKNACDVLVTIPMLGRAESLNAAAAASITMWEMLR